MDVRFQPGDVANAHGLAGRRHQLHDADGPAATAGVLPESRFLVALRDQQERVEGVLVGILVEDLEGVPEALQARVGQRGLQEFSVLDVLVHQAVAEQRPLAVGARELTDVRGEFRGALADQPAQLTAGVDRRGLVNTQVGEDPVPQARRVVVNDRRIDQAGTHHFEQVVVGQRLGGGRENDGAPAGGEQPFIERREVTPVAG